MCTWKRIWDFEPVSSNPTLISSIIIFGISTDLKVSGEDVKVLMDELSEELITQKLQDLDLEVQQYRRQTKILDLDEDEETEDNVLSSEIKDVVFMWSKVQKFVEKNNPT